jgi:uncharacterized protein (TIGR00156 family)
MKNTVFVIFMTLVFFSCELGWEGGPPVYSISDAKKAWDGASVVLDGTIGDFLGGEKWNFSESSDSIPVEIDGEWWRGPHALVEGEFVTIYGEVEKELWQKTYIDVNRVVKKGKTLVSHTGGLE